MNKKILILGLALFLAALFIILQVWNNSSQSSTEQSSTINASTLKKGLAITEKEPSPSVLSPLIDRTEQKRILLEAANVPIEFWGKVINDAGVGLSGVKVEYLVQRAGRVEANGSVADDESRGSLVTNGDGDFSVKNAMGTTLSISGIVKEGYVLSANQHRIFGYMGTPVLHVPKRQAPQVFVMHSIKDNADVQSVRSELGIPWNGNPIRIDLENGKPSSSGALVLTASRTTVTGRFGWKLSLSLDGGELSEAKPGTGFAAPEDGYLRNWQCGYDADAKTWRFGRDANVYYRLKGKFGRLKLQIYADAGPNDVSVHFERFANIGGGRNTESKP